MNNKKPIIKILSLVSMLAISNISFASAREMPNMMSFGAHEAKANEKINNRELAQVKPSNREHSFSDLIFKFEKHKLVYDNMYGLFLQFGEGKITLDELEKDMANKIKLASALKVSMYESGELYKDTIIDVWKKADRGLKNHRKEFDEKKVSLNNLREQYKARGVWWFSTQYGLQDDSDKLAGAKSDDFPEAISSSKKGELKK